MHPSDIEVIPAPEARETPLPVYEGEDMCSVLLEGSFLFHEIVWDLIRNVRELRPEKIRIIARSAEFPTPYPLDLLFVCKGREVIADHAGDCNILAIFADVIEDEVRLYDRVCTALHQSVPVVDWKKIFGVGQKDELVVDLVVGAREGTWVRGSSRGQWFRCLIPGRVDDSDPMYPLNVIEVGMADGRLTLSCVESDLEFTVQTTE